MKKLKKEQRPIHIGIETFNKLQEAYLQKALSQYRGDAKPLMKSEFYTEIIEKGLAK